MKKAGLDILPFLYQFAMVFGFVSKIRLGPFTSLRLVLLVAIIVIFLKMGEVKHIIRSMDQKKLHKSFLLLAFCLLITIFHAAGTQLSSNTYFTPDMLLTIIISLFIVGLWSGVTFDSKTSFCRVLVAVGIVQSLSVFASVAIPGFQSFVVDHFLYEGFTDKVDMASIEDLARTPGIGIAWSTGSLLLAYCCFALVFLKIESKIDFVLFGFLYALIAGATALMGRTGLIVEIVLLAFWGFSTGKMKNIISLMVVLIVGLLIFNQVMTRLDPFVAESTQRWMLAFLDSDKVSYTNEGILKGGFPDFSEQFVFGTGITYGRYGNYSFYADSGYIKSYTSIGVVGMVCYYLGILYLIISTFPKRLPKIRKVLLWVAIVIIYVVEYKEPFISGFIYPWIIFSIGILWKSEQKNIIYENTYSRRLCAQK